MTDQEKVVLKHLPDVHRIAKRIHHRLPHNIDLNDLVSAGTLGLLDACRRFDAAKKVRFSTFAHFRIKGAILDSLRAVDWASRGLRRRSRTIENCIGELTSRLGRAPAEPEIARAMGMPLPEYQELLEALAGLEIGSLHSTRFEDGQEELAYVPTPLGDDPLFQCMSAEMKRRLASAIDGLPDRERLVLTLYYYEELTMKEIGSILGICESRVSQIHSSAVLRLRSQLCEWAELPE